MIRVYVLAKELKTDSRVIFDLCRKVGVKREDCRKGVGIDSKRESDSEPRLTAFSRLSDEDADRVRELFKELRAER